MNHFAKFKSIRAAYSHLLPKWMAEYEATGNMYHDPYSVDVSLTHIEDPTWCAIRSSGVPMYPQIPALNYFLDFANPFLRIAIECDGAQYHDAEKDALRDERLVAAGWTIFRVTGRECKKVMQEPWDKFSNRDAEENEEEQVKYWRDWFCNTVDGLVMAIKLVYFGGAMVSKKYLDGAAETLSAHRSFGDSTVPKHPSRNKGSD